MDHSMHHNSSMAPSSYPMRKKMMMHMTFFWGHNAEVLFDGWPGNSLSMYVLALFVIFSLAILVEWLSHSKLIKSGTTHVLVGLVQTGIHTVRVVLSYMIMLAVMSFNVGILMAAVGGHCIGFLIFGSGIFNRNKAGEEPESTLLPMKC